MFALRRTAIASMVIVAGLVSGCSSSDSTSPSPNYEQIAGSYNASVIGVSQGIALDGLVSFSLQQNAGTLTGTWSLSGTLTNLVGQTVPVLGTGPLGGTIAAGNNPSVNITIRSGSCPAYSRVWSGTYDVANRRLTMNGQLDILDGCNVALTYNTVAQLQR